MEDITDTEYRHAKKVFKIFNNKNISDYHNLCVQGDESICYLLMYLKILEICVLKNINLTLPFFICTRINMASLFKKDKNKKQALNHGLVLKKVHRMIEFNQEAWLKPYIDMNIELKKKQKMILIKTF